jgi:ABC-type multidrug transport system ATPase subunit
MHDVHRSFGAHRVLDGVDLEVHDSEICVVTGENGAGKSTLLDVATFALSATRGRIAIDGAPIEEPRARRRVGYAPAHAPLPESLAIHEWMDLVAAMRAVRAAEVDVAAERWGLAAITDARLSTLSLGQRRRLALAVATMGAPSLLVLDEPTVGLDAAGVDQLVAYIETHRASGGSALIASHDEPFASATRATMRKLVRGRLAPE